MSAWTRRDVLKAGGLGALGLGAGPSIAPARPARGDGRAVIALVLVGGPSQLETFDPKPDAPAEVRGPFGSIPTAVPGVRVGEHLPRVAAMMGKLTLIRSLGHDSAPIHETGLQLIQTGRLSRGDGPAQPNLGASASRLLGSRGGAPPWVVTPGPIGHTGVAIDRGQSAGLLGPAFGPALVDDRDDAGLDAYGHTEFGRSCLRARRLVESGVRLVTVNMYRTVFGQPSWDCHGLRPFATPADYRDTVLPTFDLAFTALVADLDRLGLLDSTLVVASGEFGRTPRLNAAGGRDHWPACWSAVLAGGGFGGGQVIGATDAHAAEVVDRPFPPEELVATMARHLGIEPVGGCESETPASSAGVVGPLA